MAALDRVAHERVLRLQVEDVVLVDAWRHDDEWPLAHLRRGWRVLNKLDQLVLVDHCARRRRDVAAYFESRLVGVRDPTLRKIVEEQPHAVGHALAARFDGELDGFRIRP